MLDKEPWLAVNLSAVFPGLGQLYSGDKSKGYIILLVSIALKIIAFWLICSSTGDIVIGVLILVATIVVWFWNLFDAYACAKSKNTQDFEMRRKQSKDPWLAMFLSQLFLGIGHFYIGKWLFGIFAIILILVFTGLSQFISPFVVGCIAYLAYILSPVKRERSNTLALIVATLIIITSLFSVGSAFLTKTYIVEARWIPSGAIDISRN
jgi:signal peptidase I